MDLKNIIITRFKDAYSVYSVKGRYEKMQNRECYGISFCTSGQITYIQDGIECVSDVGSAIILPKGGNYFIRGDKTGNFPVINFDCPHPLCERVTAIPIKNAKALLSDYERIRKLFCFGGSRAQIFSILYGIFHQLSKDSIPYPLKRAIELIKSEYGDPRLTNERLAAESKISEVYFRKLFSEYMKTTPKQYVLDIRLQKAKQMLSEGSYSVSLIAERCGFSNPYHFSRIFKDHVGKSPSEYRKENLIYKI